MSTRRFVPPTKRKCRAGTKVLHAGRPTKIWRDASRFRASTIDHWIDTIPEFSDSIQEGRDLRRRGRDPEALFARHGLSDGDQGSTLIYRASFARSR